MKVLVCGGAGYIGSNMTATLAREGHEPIVFDNLSKGHRSAIGDARLIRGDLADTKLIAKTLKANKIQAVMHFAALIEVGESVENPLAYYRNNFSNTQNLLSAMESVGVEKFVFSSTAAVYGIPKSSPITEDSPTAPINPYGHSKLAVESMCRYLSQTGRLRYAALRYFNACGAGNDGKYGEHHKPESHLIPLIIRAAMGKKKDIKIFGVDYPTPDGTCVRDYIHVDDLCRAHILALDKLDDTSEITCNLGNGTGYSVRQVIDTVKAVSGRDFTVTEADRRPGDPPELVCDSTKARAELAWNPQMPELDRIVETAWKWHSEHPDGYGD